MQTHIRVLGVLQILYASIGVLLGLTVLLVFGGVAAIVGVSASPLDSLKAVPVLALIGTLAAGFLMALSLPRLIAGIGLLKQRPWARVLTIVVSVIGLFDVPVGLILGIYGLWVTTSPAGTAMFEVPRAEATPLVQ
ncbi:MAG: hypothetical protein ABI051_04510 [Vicinamibacterales bacterium]